MAKKDPWVPLRKSYPDSQKVNSVSIGAEMLFTRLLAQCDDHSHYWADPGIIAGKLLTQRVVQGETTQEDAAKWLRELVDEDLVVLYQVRGIAYLEVVNCKKHLRNDINHNVQYPDPPKSLQKQGRTESVTETYRERNENVAPYSDSDSDSDTDSEESAARVVWNGKTFALPDTILNEYQDRFPNIPRHVIQQEIQDCAEYHADKGTSIKSPRGTITTWLKRAFKDTFSEPTPTRRRGVDLSRQFGDDL